VTGNESILITSFIEPEHVARIADMWDGPVVYEPDLLPTPRYVSDHGGTKPGLDEAGRRRWRELLASAEICFDFDWFEPDELRANCPNLRWVQATSAGIGGYIDRFDLADSGIAFTTAAGVHGAPLAEFAITGALHFVKDVPLLVRRSRERVWERYTAASLAGRHVTVVGLGSVGRASVAAFAALGAVVTGVGRPGRSYDVPGATRLTDTDQFDDVLPDSEILVLATPLTSLTRKLIDARRIALLPRGGIVVNIGRGPLIEQPALLAALDEGRLLGAALDVTDPEPPPADDAVWNRSDVLLSPHSASTMPGENAAITDIFVDNLERWRSGRELRNVYRAEEGY
jgi:glyoxylate/hydroxypyruvate reductase A